MPASQSGLYSAPPCRHRVRTQPRHRLTLPLHCTGRGRLRLGQAESAAGSSRLTASVIGQAARATPIRRRLHGVGESWGYPPPYFYSPPLPGAYPPVKKPPSAKKRRLPPVELESTCQGSKISSRRAETKRRLVRQVEEARRAVCPGSTACTLHCLQRWRACDLITAWELKLPGSAPRVQQPAAAGVTIPARWSAPSPPRREGEGIAEGAKVGLTRHRL